MKILSRFILALGIIILFYGIINLKTEDKTMLNFVGRKYNEAKFFAEQYNLDLNVTYENSSKYNKDIVISQSIKEGTTVKENDKLNIVVAK